LDLQDFGVDLLDPNIDIDDFFDWLWWVTKSCDGILKNVMEH
jgi:hypothetical protein